MAQFEVSKVGTFGSSTTLCSGPIEIVDNPMLLYTSGVYLVHIKYLDSTCFMITTLLLCVYRKVSVRLYLLCALEGLLLSELENRLYLPCYEMI